jgi:hypothetical protein
MSRVGRQRGRKMDRLAGKELMDEEYPHVSRRHPCCSFRTGSDLSLYGFTPQLGCKASVAVEQIAACGGLDEALFKPLNQRRQVKGRLHERAPRPLFRGSIRMDTASQTDYRARPTRPFPMRPASPRVEFLSLIHI